MMQIHVLPLIECTLISIILRVGPIHKSEGYHFSSLISIQVLKSERWSKGIGPMNTWMIQPIFLFLIGKNRMLKP